MRRPAERSPTALANAFQNFCINSFHVLLSALCGVDEPDQVSVETWRIGGTDDTAVIGHMGARATEGGNVPIPDGLFQAIEHAIRSDALLPRLHWFRFFVGMAGDKPTFESLHQNEPWAPGLETLQSLSWPTGTGYYSVRLFLMLKPPVA